MRSKASGGRLALGVGLLLGASCATYAAVTPAPEPAADAAVDSTTLDGPVGKAPDAQSIDATLVDATTDAPDASDASSDAQRDAPLDTGPSCSDGIRNGQESDVDCGGACAKKCAIGKACIAALDCTSGSVCARGEKCELPKSCADLPTATKSGPFQVKPDSLAIDTYCDFVAPAGPWTLVFSSNGDPNGKTTAFWDIAYADRFKTKGVANPVQNFYAGELYRYGRTYRDDVVDLNKKSFVAMVATATGFDPIKMTFTNPSLVSGNNAAFSAQFAAGWAAKDYDGDTYVDNCATRFSSVMQHYSSCWSYNLGSDADPPYLDDGWGPHIGGLAGELGTATDGSLYTRVSRITRWTKF
jgi:hypothetical protein